jgi:hypothetical protein
VKHFKLRRVAEWDKQQLLKRQEAQLKAEQSELSKK